MFGIIDRLLFQPPPHGVDAGALRQVGIAYPPDPWGSTPAGGVDFSLLQAVQEHVPGFAAVAGATDRPIPGGSGNMTLGVGLGALPVRGVVVTGNYLPMLGVRPEVGRLLLPADDAPSGATPAAVIDHALWQRAFGSARDILGGAIQVDSAWYVVAGVVPAAFRGVEASTPDVWLPLGPVAAARNRPPSVSIVARLRDDVPEGLARAQASRVLLASLPPPDPTLPAFTRPTGATLAPISRPGDIIRERDRRVSVLVSGVSLLLFLVAAASVANLLLARSIERRQEIAIRLALGVSRRRLALQLLGESLLLAFAGGAIGLLIVHRGGAALQRVLLGDSGVPSFLVDGRVLGYTLAAAVLAGLLAGIAPAIQASRPSLAAALGGTAQAGGARASA